MSVYNFYTIEVDGGRSGSLSGAYLAKPEDMESLKGERFYATDILGKHSEISFRWGVDDVSPKITISESWKVVDLDLIAKALKKSDDQKYIYVAGFPFMRYVEEYDDE